MPEDIKVLDVPIEEIHNDAEFNCRGTIAPVDVVDLVKDIEQHGLMQPIVLRPYRPDEQLKTGKKYRLVMGYRRYTAHIVLERKTIPAIIREDIKDDVQARFMNLNENLKRQDLNIIQESKAIYKLKLLGISEGVVADQLGKSRGWVQIRYMFLDLPIAIQAEVAVGNISQSNIRELYTIFHNAGEEKCLIAARAIKEAKARGHTISVNPKNQEMNVKKVRKKFEIFHMMEHMQEYFGNGLFTRALAWAAGEITDFEIDASMREFAEQNGKEYTPYKPKDFTGA